MPSGALNFQHLHYFWIVAREGGISRASDALDVSPSTISAQVGQLERAMRVKLFHRVGRNIQLTDVGHVAFRYAEEIFSLGNEMTHAIHGWHTEGPVLLQVGIADAVPKLVATRLLRPALSELPELKLICREDRPDRLLAELALHQLDVLLLDRQPEANLPVQVYKHLLADWPIGIFGREELVNGRSDDFPHSLESAPILLPTAGSAIRRQLDRFFEDRGIQGRLVGEFEDSALMKSFGESGAGLFPAPAGLADDLERQHGAKLLGVLDEYSVSYFGLTVERQLEHPGVAAICRNRA
ncbi:MAG: LysR family transcriptional regulator [Acidobacteriota bacterium]